MDDQEKSGLIDRREYWMALGREYAHQLVPTITDVKIAFEYVLQYQLNAYRHYASDSNPDEAEQLFANAFVAELPNVRPSNKRNK